MEFQKSSILGVYVVKPRLFKDNRGSFIKSFNKEIFERMGLESQFAESYYSTSKKGVIRGMHFQTPPSDHVKIVYTSFGVVKDVILDIRKNSPTFGKFEVNELSWENGLILYLPKGVAHGFTALTDDSCVNYIQSTVYNSSSDTGIRYDSFGYDWKVEKPLLSERDNNFISFKDFDSPF